MLISAEILLANDNVTKVIEDYRRIVGTPGDISHNTTTSANSSTTPDVVKSSAQSPNLSSLIDLDIGTSNVSQPPAHNGDMLSNDLQGLGELKKM